MTLTQTATQFPVVDYVPQKQYPSFSTIINEKMTVTTSVVAAGITLTAAQIMGGLILHDPGGAVNDTLDTAANIVAAIEGAEVGSAIQFTVRNTADASETITIVAGTGGTISGTATIAQNNQKRFLLIVTALGATPTYTCYSMGTVTF